jgi:hypothetical protein
LIETKKRGSVELLRGFRFRPAPVGFWNFSKQPNLNIQGIEESQMVKKTVPGTTVAPTQSTPQLSAEDARKLQHLFDLIPALTELANYLPALRELSTATANIKELSALWSTIKQHTFKSISSLRRSAATD